MDPSAIDMELWGIQIAHPTWGDHLDGSQDAPEGSEIP